MLAHGSLTTARVMWGHPRTKQKTYQQAVFHCCFIMLSPPRLYASPSFNRSIQHSVVLYHSPGIRQLEICSAHQCITFNHPRQCEKGTYKSRALNLQFFATTESAILICLSDKACRVTRKCASLNGYSACLCEHMLWLWLWRRCLWVG